MTTASLAFVGLGVMGFPMAGHLAAAGHKVTVYNRSREKAQAWTAAHAGSAAATPREAAAGADIVFSCVGNDDDVRSVVYGEDGIFAGIRPGSVYVDHTTASADLARELYAEGGNRGVACIDAPVSGGQAGAENGVLTVMCGGDSEPFERARPAMTCYGRAVTLLGAPGNGQLTKMVNQIAIAGLLQGLSEALNMGLKAGLDMPLVLEVISKGAAGSWQMDNRGQTMVEDKFDFGFAVDWMRKDLAICLAEAERNGARLPMTAAIDQFYKHVQQEGGGRWDTSALIHLLRNT